MFNYDCSSIFVLLWNMCNKKLPSSIIDNFNQFLMTTEIPRMKNENHNLHKKTVDYSIIIDNVKVDFSSVENALSVGCFVIKYIHETNNETCPHHYAIFWTTHPSFGNEDGGNFFITEHEIRIYRAQNLLVVWRPIDYCSTTLLTKDLII